LVFGRVVGSPVMSRKILLKALLISNFVNLLLYVAGMAIWVAGWWAYATILGDSPAIMAKLDWAASLPGLAIMAGSTNLLAAVPAGYLAARMAKPGGELLQGALSATVIVLINLYYDVWGFPGFDTDINSAKLMLSRALYVAISCSGPLLGMLGAYLGLRRPRPTTA
jgi:hypothetical protein